MPENIFNKNFRLIFSLIFLAEILSFLGYYYQGVNFIAFFVITTLVLILSLYKLEYSLFILLAELLIGSFGYLFYFENGGLKISLRLALWLIIMSVWLSGQIIKFIRTKPYLRLSKNFVILNGAKRSEEFLISANFSELDSSPSAQNDNPRIVYPAYFSVLFIFIAWGVVNGFLENNSINNIFFDANSWLYFLLVFPVFSVLQADENLKTVKQIFLTSTVYLSFKTIILAYIFSHNFDFFALDLYLWVRRSGVGEITQVAPGFSRIFMQSQIFILIGVFVLLFYLLMNDILTCHSRSRRLSPRICGEELAARIYYFIINFLKSPIYGLILDSLPVRQAGRLRGNDKRETIIYNNRKKLFTSYFLLLTSYLSVIIISFSRSFWLGLAAGSLFVWLVAIFKLKTNLKKFIAFNLTALFAVALSLALTFLIIKFPYPKPPDGLNAANVLSERTTQIANEAGVASRWQLLPSLWQKIKTAPILGRGFGATVTYKSNDPRILASNPKGEYATYAFEWGWLDIWLKLGIFGLLAYLILFIKIIADGLKISSPTSLALTAGLIVLLAVNIFSPYVNHPLGIGYIILAAAIMDYLKNNLRNNAQSQNSKRKCQNLC